MIAGSTYLVPTIYIADPFMLNAYFRLA
jgi:hypothetical protein